MGDFYPIQRGEPVADYAAVLDSVVQGSGGKFVMAWIEASNQHLDPTYYPGKRAPTVPEFLTEITQATVRGLSIGLFPQRIGQDGTGFAFRDWPPEIEAAFKAWAKPTNQPTIVTADPLANAAVTINGRSYTLVPK